MSLQFNHQSDQLKVVDSTNANASMVLTPSGTGSVLLNGTGQNLLQQSQTFTVSPWSLGGTGTPSITANTTIAPDGTSTASTLTGNNGNNSNRIQQSISVIASQTYICSFYIKNINVPTSSQMHLSFPTTTTTNSQIQINWSGNTISSIQNTGTAVGQFALVGNGWYRVWYTANAGVGDTGTAVYRIYQSNNDSGLGNLSVYIWGAQVEVGNLVNPYVTTTSAAIYNAPVLSFSGVANIGLQSDGSLYVQPAGTGALQAQATTGTNAGGNARGTNAIDLQTSRNSASMVSSGTYSNILGGISGSSTSYASVLVGGTTNYSSGTASFLGGGGGNITGGNYTVIVGGGNNSALGFYNFIGGGYTNTGTAQSAVTTQSANTYSNTVVTLSTTNSSIKVGQFIQGTNIPASCYVSAISGTSLTLSTAASGSGTSTLSFFTPHGVVVGGGNNTANGSYSFVGGGGDAGTAANGNIASGDWSFVGGGIKNAASNLATVVSGGYGNIASGFASFVGGGGLYGTWGTFAPNISSGTSSVVTGGWNNTASAAGSGVLSGVENQATSSYSAVVGGSYGVSRGIVGNIVFPACNNPLGTPRGASQSSLLVLAKQTTDATPTVLVSDGSAATTYNQVILPNNSAYYFKGRIIAGVTGGGNTSAWTFEGAIKRGANAASTSIVGVINTTLVAQDSGASSWAVAFSADTTNGGLAVTVTGQSSTTIRWVAKLETTEMTF